MIQYGPILRRIWTAPPVPGHPSPPVTLWMFKKKPVRWTGSGWYWHVLAEAHVWYFRTFLKFKCPQSEPTPHNKIPSERNWYELMLCPTDSCTSNSLRENSNHLKAMSQLQITCHYWWCVYIYIYTCDIPLYFISYIFNHHISRDVEHILVPQRQRCHPVIFLWSINPISKWYTV